MMTLSKHKRLCFWMIMIFFLMTLPLGALEDAEIEQKKTELEEIEAAIEKFEKLYKDKEREGKQVLGQIRDLENNICSLNEDVNTLCNRISITELLLNNIQEEIEKTLLLVEERTAYFNPRLNEIYLQGEVSFLEVLFQSTDWTDFLTRFDFLQKIAESDLQKLKILNKTREELALKKADLQEQVANYNFLKNQKEQKQRQMELQSRQKNNLLKTIEQQKDEYLRSIKELEVVRKSIDRFIKEWQAEHQEAYLGSGKMGWPLPGHTRITSPFGWRTHPIFKERSFHPAIDIAAPTGTLVLASETGRVIYVGNKGGYGQAIILDHGGGISTQYSHLSAYLVKVGDFVLKGDPIGKVGSTGWSTGPHLDFIIRVNGEPEDPLKYVKAV